MRWGSVNASHYHTAVIFLGVRICQLYNMVLLCEDRAFDAWCLSMELINGWIGRERSIKGTTMVRRIYMAAVEHRALNFQDEDERDE